MLLLGIRSFFSLSVQIPSQYLYTFFRYSSLLSRRYLVSEHNSSSYKPIILEEKDLEEQFVKGSGNGGQKVNKTSNCVVLTHLPTKLQVRCHDTRSLHQNRSIARKRLKEQLDLLINGDQSKKQQKILLLQKKKRKKTQKSKKKYHVLNDSLNENETKINIPSESENLEKRDKDDM